jgi:hypothetical protein
MNEYKISTLVNTRVLNYRFSVKSKSDPQYVKLSQSIKEHNLKQTQRELADLEPHFLRIRGRGRNPIMSGPQNSRSVTDDNASYFDVYVQRDTDAMARYRIRTAKNRAKGIITTSIKNIANLMVPTQATN